MCTNTGACREVRVTKILAIMLENSNARGKPDFHLLILCLSLLELTYSAPTGSPAFPSSQKQGIGINLVLISITEINYAFKLVLEELHFL